MTSELVTPRFALAIPHAGWKPDRVASLARLFEQLRGAPWVVPTRVFSDREPNHVWSVKLWRSILEDDQATHLLQLQDDCQVNPTSFWRNLMDIVTAHPTEIIGLESVHPISESIHRTGGPNWYTTTDGLIGVAYVLPRASARDLLRWRAQSLRPGAAEALNEDQMIGLFAATTGRRIYHPVPTIVDHDVDLPSTYGNDGHGNRRPLVTTVGAGGVASPKSRWCPEPPPIHTGLMYGATPRLARRYVIGVHTTDMRRIAETK